MAANVQVRLDLNQSKLMSILKEKCRNTNNTNLRKKCYTCISFIKEVTEADKTQRADNNFPISDIEDFLYAFIDVYETINKFDITLYNKQHSLKAMHTPEYPPPTPSSQPERRWRQRLHEKATSILEKLRGNRKNKEIPTNYERIMDILIANIGADVPSWKLAALFPNSTDAPDMVSTSIRTLNKTLVKEHLRITHKSSYTLQEVDPDEPQPQDIALETTG